MPFSGKSNITEGKMIKESEIIFEPNGRIATGKVIFNRFANPKHTFHLNKEPMKAIG